MVEKDTYNELMQKYGNVSSWAIWAPAGKTPKSNTSDLTVFDDENLLNILNPNYVFVGLNASSTHGDQAGHADRPWFNFHSDYYGQNDFKLRYALVGTKYWGAYITDVIKDYPEINSGKVSDYLRNHPEFANEKINEFREELMLLGTHPTLISLGGTVYSILKKYLGSQYRIIKIKHYSAYISKENYRDEILKFLDMSVDI